jgi:hypothetical protein
MHLNGSFHNYIIIIQIYIVCMEARDFTSVLSFTHVSTQEYSGSASN